MKTETGKANIAKVPGGYHVRVREGLGYSSPRHARTLTEAKVIAAKLEAGYAARIARLTARERGAGVKWTWDQLMALNCRQLRALGMYHVDTIVGTLMPVRYPRPLRCSCPR